MSQISAEERDREPHTHQPTHIGDNSENPGDKSSKGRIEEETHKTNNRKHKNSLDTSKETNLTRVQQLNRRTRHFQNKFPMSGLVKTTESMQLKELGATKPWTSEKNPY